MPNTSHCLNQAHAWISTYSLPPGGIATTSRQRVPYPEVTGYCIPSLLAIGDHERATAYARWLVDVQKPDGSFSAPGSEQSFVFDTGQVVRGWVELLPELPELEVPLHKACSWLANTADDHSGRLRVPAPGGAWRLGDRGEVSEAVHLYVLPPLRRASRLLGNRRWEDLVQKSLAFYKRSVDLTRFDQRTMLTHLFCYIQEALVELGEMDLARQGMMSLASHQHDSGAVPAYADVEWICTPGLLQAAIVWYKLGDRERADKALAFAEELMNPSGGFYGSYGVGAEYFPAEEPSWATKFFIDACLLRDRTTTDAPSSTASATRGLEQREWFDAITHGSTPQQVCDRVRAGQVPEWITPLLEQSQPGDELLELGSGTGELSAFLASKGRKPVLLDFSESCLAFSREVFRLLGLSGTFVHADIRQTFPLPDLRVDIAWSSGVLEHFSDNEVVHILRESRRVSRHRVVSLVPNAASIAYRLGKWEQEQSGKWQYGYEDPKFSLADQFRDAGLRDIQEHSIAADHATQFLTAPQFQPVGEALKVFYRSLDDDQLRKLNQGYLLVTSAITHEPRRLVVVPNDPLQAYVDAGYPDLTEYFNPCHFFDEVYCLSPLESTRGEKYGMKVIPTRREEFAARVKETQANIVRAYDLPAGHFACAPDVAVPVVVSVHDVNPARVPATPPEAERFLAISSAVEHFLRGMGADANHIIRFANRVDMSVFRPIDDPVRRAEFQHRFPGRYRILHVGRKDRQKNQDTLIRALSLVGPDFTAIFVGKGDDTPLRAQAAELGVLSRCHFVESVPNSELPFYYSFADCMCTPSRWEGFGIVFIEALACEAVVVTSDIAPMNEYIHHEVNGILVPAYEDPTAVARAVHRACTDRSLRHSLKNAARSSVRRFSKEEVDLQEVAIYRSLLEQQAEHPAAAAPSVEKELSDVRNASSRSQEFEIIPFAPDLKEVWDDVVRKSADAWMYHWYDEQVLLAESWKVEQHSFLVAHHGKPVAICPLHRHRENAFLDSTAMGPGGPAIVTDVSSAEADAIRSAVHHHIRKVLEESKSRGIAGCHIFIPPLSHSGLAAGQSARNPLLEFGYKDISTQTAILSMQERTFENLFQSFRKNLRYDIRQAEQAGVMCVPSVSPQDVAVYYQLHEETYRRTGVPPHPREYFEGIWRHFVESGRARMLFAVHEGVPVAALNLALFGTTALYWTGANSRRALELGAGKLLLSEAIRWAHSCGYEWFEIGEVFETANGGSKLSGLTQLKSAYGGEIHSFFKGVLNV